MKVSQREAHRLRKRVAELERTLQRFYNAWGSDFIGGTHLGTVPPDAVGQRLFGALEAARKLKHAVCINAHNDGVKFYALPLPKDIL
jgi:hypothetical protein